MTEAGRRPAGTRAYTWAWVLSALLLTAVFLIGHPAPPAAGPTGPTGPTAGTAASHAHAIAAALVFAGLLAAGGYGASRLLGVSPSPAVSFALGSLFSALLSLLLLAPGWFRLWLLGPLLLLPLLFRGRPREIRLRLGALVPERGAAPLFVLGALAAVALLVRTLAPLHANDPIVYHMTLARAYATSGGLAGAPDLVYARMPHASDLLFAGAYLAGGEGAARVLHLLAALACAGLAGTLARDLFGARSGAGAAALFLTLPLVLDARTIGNTDLFAALFFGTSLLLVVRHAREGRGGDLAAAGLLAGGMLATKLSTYAAYPLLLVPLLIPIGIENPRAGRLRKAALFLIVSHLPLLPWAVKAWAETGNPLYPLFYSILDGRGWDAAREERLIAWQRSIGMGRDALPMLLLPWNAIMRGARGYPFFDGVLSPALLLWVPWGWIRGGRAARSALLLALAGIYLWGIGPQQLRFLLPVVLLLSSVCGASWKTEKGTFGLVQGALFLAIAALLVAPFLMETARDTLPVVLGRESREEYLSRKVQSYEAFRQTEARVPEREKVLLVWENRIYYFSRPYLADSFFEASRVVRLAEKEGSAEALLDRLKREGFRWVLVNRPLERVFERYSPTRAVALLDTAWERCEPIGSWNGLDLYRIPAHDR